MTRFLTVAMFLFTLLALAPAANAQDPYPGCPPICDPPPGPGQCPACPSGTIWSGSECVPDVMGCADGSCNPPPPAGDCPGSCGCPGREPCQSVKALPERREPPRDLIGLLRRLKPRIKPALVACIPKPLRMR